MEYFTPKGKSLAGKGLSPDIEVGMAYADRVSFAGGRLSMKTTSSCKRPQWRWRAGIDGAAANAVRVGAVALDTPDYCYYNTSILKK
jgi:hypothetical protein